VYCLSVCVRVCVCVCVCMFVCLCVFRARTYVCMCLCICVCVCVCVCLCACICVEQHCFNINNFSGLTQLLFTLNMRCITRLKQTWLVRFPLNTPHTHTHTHTHTRARHTQDTHSNMCTHIHAHMHTSPNISRGSAPQQLYNYIENIRNTQHTHTHTHTHIHTRTHTLKQYTAAPRRHPQEDVWGPGQLDGLCGKVQELPPHAPLTAAAHFAYSRFTHVHTHTYNTHTHT